MVASGTCRLATSARGRPSLEEGAGRHERERRALQTSGRATHDEPVDDDGLRVQRWANLVSAASAVTNCFQQDQIVFSVNFIPGEDVEDLSVRFGFQQDFLEARGVAQGYSGARWSRSAGFLIRSMTIKANSKIVRERIGINRFAIEIGFQLLYPDLGAPLHEASDFAVNFAI